MKIKSIAAALLMLTAAPWSTAIAGDAVSSAVLRSLPPEERKRVNGWTLRIENSFDSATSRWKARWFRLRRATAKAKEGAQELIGESEIRLYSAHELAAMLRPERWSRVELYGGLDGTPFSLDAPRLVLVAWK